MPGDEYTVYATTYGSWATILPKGHQILKIDFTLTDNGWKGDIDVFGKDVGTPLPITGAQMVICITQPLTTGGDSRG